MQMSSLLCSNITFHHHHVECIQNPQESETFLLLLPNFMQPRESRDKAYDKKQQQQLDSSLWFSSGLCHCFNDTYTFLRCYVITSCNTRVLSFSNVSHPLLCPNLYAHTETKQHSSFAYTHKSSSVIHERGYFRRCFFVSDTKHSARCISVYCDLN